MRILKESGDGITYREIYNSIVKATENFTKDSGTFKYETNYEANLAKKILEDKYSRVYLKPINLGDENDIFYTVVYGNLVEESLLENYLLTEDVGDSSDFVRKALLEHPELRVFIRDNKWEDLWNAIGGRGPKYDDVQGDLYPRDRSVSSNYWGPSAIGKFLQVFQEAGINYKIEEIPEYCFTNSDITSFKIPEGTKGIGLSAFSHCTKLETIDIPDSVEDISVSAFFSCTSLKEIKLPPHLKMIGGSAFKYCKSLTEIIVPEGCTYIGETAFAYCTSLRTVVIPKSCTTLSKGVLYGCKKLESVTLPDKKYKYMEYMRLLGIDKIPKRNIKIDEALPVEEEDKNKYKDFGFQADKNPAGTPLGNGTGLGEDLVEKIVKKGSQWQVQSEKGKNMGTYDTKQEAEERLRQVEYFKHKNESINDDEFKFDPNYNPAGTPLGNGTGLGEDFDDDEDYPTYDCTNCGAQCDWVETEMGYEVFRCPECGKKYWVKGDDVLFGESLNERFYDDERRTIESTLLDGEPTFDDWLDTFHDMSVDDVEVEPEVEKYYLNEYSKWLDSLYDIEPYVPEDDEVDHTPSSSYYYVCYFEDDDANPKEISDTENTLDEAISKCKDYISKDGYDCVEIYGPDGSTVATFYNGKWNTNYNESLEDEEEDNYWDYYKSEFEPLKEAAKKDFRAELYYFDSQNPDDTVYFPSLKDTYKFCNREAEDNDLTGLTGIIIYNNSTDKKINT